MSVKFVTVQWNKRKIVYDVVLLAAVAAYYFLFTGLGRSVLQGAQAISGEVLAMRAWGSCAFFMLVAILCIGPLARLSPRFKPLLYNRRHFGVLMFVVGVLHARAVLGYYHAYSDVRPIESLFTWDVELSGQALPFQLFGAGALLIFAVMALTSHDFWQKLFGAGLWKTLHMGVYAAFALVLAHVAFGALQYETHPAYFVIVFGAAALVGVLHVMAALRDGRAKAATVHDGWIDAGSPDAIPEDRAIPVEVPDGERIALIRTGGKVCALHGVCAHQGGPLYEGKVIDGSLTCPWHGWQYRPEDGCSPPPFTEKLPTYRVRLKDGRVLVDPKPLPAGTPTEPVVLEEPDGGS